MAKGGRPSKLTSEVQERICDIIRGGNYLENACAIVGVTKQSAYTWLKRAHASRRSNRVSKHTRFLDAIEKARAEAEAMLLAGIEGDWTAKAWRLERLNPKRYRRPSSRSAAIEALEAKKLRAEIAALEQRAAQLAAGESGETIRVEVWGKGGLPPKAEP